jgi:hypothetical protein
VNPSQFAARLSHRLGRDGQVVGISCLKHLYYALVQEDNPSIQRILGRNGEVKIKSLYSELAAKELGLWVSV